MTAVTGNRTDLEAFVDEALRLLTRIWVFALGPFLPNHALQVAKLLQLGWLIRLAVHGLRIPEPWSGSQGGTGARTVLVMREQQLTTGEH